jgi:hypothetical protein
MATDIQGLTEASLKEAAATASTIETQEHEIRGLKARFARKGKEVDRLLMVEISRCSLISKKNRRLTAGRDFEYEKVRLARESAETAKAEARLAREREMAADKRAQAADNRAQALAQAADNLAQALAQAADNRAQAVAKVVAQAADNRAQAMDNARRCLEIDLEDQTKRLELQVLNEALLRRAAERKAAIQHAAAQRLAKKAATRRAQATRAESKRKLSEAECAKRVDRVRKRKDRTSKSLEQAATDLAALKKEARDKDKRVAAELQFFADKLDETQHQDSVLQGLLDSTEELTFTEATSQGEKRVVFNNPFRKACMEYLQIPGVFPPQAIPCIQAGLRMCGRTCDKMGSLSTIRRINEQLDVIHMAMAGNMLTVEPGMEGRTFFVMHQDSGTKGQMNSLRTKNPHAVLIEKTELDASLQNVVSQQMVLAGIANPKSGTSKHEAEAIRDTLVTTYEMQPHAKLEAPLAVRSQFLTRCSSVVGDNALNAVKVSSEIRQMKATLVPQLPSFQRASREEQQFQLHLTSASCDEHPLHHIGDHILTAIDALMQAQIKGLPQSIGGVRNNTSLLEGVRKVHKMLGDTTYVHGGTAMCQEWALEEETVAKFPHFRGIFNQFKDRVTGGRYLKGHLSTMGRVANHAAELEFMEKRYAARVKEDKTNGLAQEVLTLLRQAFRGAYLRAAAILYMDGLGPLIAKIRFMKEKTKVGEWMIALRSAAQHLVENPGRILELVETKAALWEIQWSFSAEDSKFVSFNLTKGIVRQDNSYGGDALTATAIATGVVALVDGINHWLCDHMPEGGRFHPSNISALDKQALTLGRARSTNAVAESALANVDRVLSFRDGLGESHVTGEVQSLMNESWKRFQELTEDEQEDQLENAKKKAPVLKKRYAIAASQKLEHKRLSHLAQIQKTDDGKQRDAQKVVELATRTCGRIGTTAKLDSEVANQVAAGKSDAAIRTFLISQIQIYGSRLSLFRDICWKNYGPEGDKLCAQKVAGKFRSNAVFIRDLKTCIGLCDGKVRDASDVNVEGTIAQDLRPPPPAPPIQDAVQHALASETRQAKLGTRKLGRVRNQTAREQPTFRPLFIGDNHLNPLPGWKLGVGVVDLSIKFSSKPCWISGSSKAVEKQLARGVEYCSEGGPVIFVDPILAR